MKLTFPPFAGKAIGAALGFLLGDWVGFALGIILGHSFDYHRRSASSFLSRFKPGTLPGRNERIYRETLFICLGHLAKQDGRVSPQEIAAAEALFKRMKLRSAERETAIARFNEGKLASTRVEARLEELRRRYASKPARRLDFIDQLLGMAYAEGGPQPAQLERLRAFLPLLDISPVEFDRLHRRIREQKGFRPQEQRAYTYQGRQQSRKSEAQPPLLSAYRTLGLNSDASAEDIKRTYRKLMSQNHPDKLMAQGLTDRALEKAKERAQEIQQAYALLKKARSI